MDFLYEIAKSIVTFLTPLLLFFALDEIKKLKAEIQELKNRMQ